MAIIRRTGAPAPTRTAGIDPFEMMREMLSWDPLTEFGRTGGRALADFTPQFEVKETKDAFVFKADLPGVKESDLEVSLQDNRLTISGKREEEKRDENDTWYAYERSFGSFSRSFTLPREADANACDAALENGVLTVRLGKRAEAQPRRIDVKSEGSRQADKGAKA